MGIEAGTVTRSFVDDVSYHEGHGEAYKSYGVDEEKGCIVIAWPDQYVGAGYG